jgi:hypothetical protein
MLPRGLIGDIKPENWLGMIDAIYAIIFTLLLIELPAQILEFIQEYELHPNLHSVLLNSLVSRHSVLCAGLIQPLPTAPMPRSILVTIFIVSHESIAIQSNILMPIQPLTALTPTDWKQTRTPPNHSLQRLMICTLLLT